MTAGLVMIPFALPMVLAPKYGTRLSARFSGRALLTAGLATVCLGNLAASVVTMLGRGYVLFAGAMLVLGCGAGLLNGLTVKVLQSSVPVERAGMASGLASTTRYMGILVNVAALGAILADVTRSRFAAAAISSGVPAEAASAAARRLASGNRAEAIAASAWSGRPARRGPEGVRRRLFGGLHSCRVAGGGHDVAGLALH